jgi:LPXTG-motif cell wall-anchored protein
LYLTKPWYLNFVGTPVFSSGAWNGQRFEGAIPNQGNGQVVLGTTNQSEMSISDLVKFGDPTDIYNSRSAIVSSPWNYGPFIFEEAELSSNGAARESFSLALNQAIAAISLGVTPSYANGGDIEVRGGNYFPLVNGAPGTPEPSALPPGLNFVCNVPIVEQSVQIGCTLPATIEGTPTQAGSYTVNLVFNNNAWGKITKTVSFTVGSLPTVTAVSPTSGSSAGGTLITITGTNFANGSTVTVGGSACTSVSVVSATSITCTTPPGTVGTASVVVTSNGQSNAGNTLFTYNVPTTTTTPPTTPATTAPATTAPATTTAPSGPVNVTSSNQATLTRTPGAATALVNGQPVSVAVETPADFPAAQVDPEDRSPAQVQSLQVAADNLVDQLNQAAGGNSGLAVQDTPTGAAITGLLTTPVPIENTVLVEAGNKSTLFAALNEDGSVTEVQPGAVIEVLGNGQVGVVASGLTPGETVEFVIMSTPTLLGTYTVASNGTIKAQTSLPDGVGLGDHTLVVASPTVQASLGLKVSATPATLPATGVSNGSNTLQIALWLIVGGLMVAYLRRRRLILN